QTEGALFRHFKSFVGNDHRQYRKGDNDCAQDQKKYFCPQTQISYHTLTHSRGSETTALVIMPG
ncbi:MAG: hypothetical protein LBR94_10695, partial [Desulfovibrio sp.]|nr:hypothetical protein [Desulfovibrio sp.]